MTEATVKPKLTGHVQIRWRVDDTLMFYMGKGEPKCGLKQNAKTARLRALLEDVFDDAVPLPEVKP